MTGFLDKSLIGAINYLVMSTLFSFQENLLVRIIKRNRFLLAGIGLALVAVTDVPVFDGMSAFIRSLTSSEPMTLWVRLIVLGLFILLGLYAQLSINKRIKVETELNQYKRASEKNSELEYEIVVRKKTEKKLEALATTDPLTGICNRRKFMEFLDHELKRVKRYRNNLSMMILDIDHFKTINDLYGHAMGDEVLKTFSALINQKVRKTDLFARWGGEEFVILLTNADIEGAKIFSNYLRQMIKSYPFKTINGMSTSIGVSQLRADEDANAFIRRADKALYDAKRNGQNCVVGVV